MSIQGRFPHIICLSSALKLNDTCLKLLKHSYKILPIFLAADNFSFFYPPDNYIVKSTRGIRS